MKALIIGGGPAGCSSAYYLKKLNVSDITIVEKDKNLGGCSHTKFYDTIPYEFGPQILYTEDKSLQNVFDEFVTNFKPKKVYKPSLSIDGELEGNSLHSFPLSFSNIIKLENSEQIIEELYKVNLKEPNYNSFEDYVKSRMGDILYQKFVKNYNIKQWKIHPKDMDAEWAKYRPLTIQQNTKGMFKGDYQGHPGDYNPLWEGMASGCKIIKGKATVCNDFKKIEIDGKAAEYDLVISTLPLSSELEFISTALIYVVIKCDQYVMPSYATSFPNNYSFVRIMEYKQQFDANSNYSLLDFQFPYKGVFDYQKALEEVRYFVKNILKMSIMEHWLVIRENTYPLCTKRNLDLVKVQIEKASASKVIPMGRAGVHAYISKDTCIRMAKVMYENFDDVTSADKEKKQKVLYKMRERLS
ncbi:FAD-dependent oxidoreductase [Flavobacterium daejeonense]|uniref:FAD-dependent oxidoreductase n=1 Tax=Flavobacterium daejeonense TaxID=350893 RepID=UPI000ADB94B9|nr:FAD-dependent oxidoreductase [Flavobacterium daejeonense]